jgi:hypothetical protein
MVGFSIVVRELDRPWCRAQLGLSALLAGLELITCHRAEISVDAGRRASGCGQNDHGMHVSAAIRLWLPCGIGFWYTGVSKIT